MVVTAVQPKILALPRLQAALALACAAWAFAATPPCQAKGITAAGTTSAEVFVQTGNSLHNTTVRFSPDGKWIASCDGVGFVLGWDAESECQYREILRHTGLCLGLSFTRTGTTG